jgi:hypothetical protein
LNKAASAPQNRKASQKPAAPLQHMSCDLWGPVSVPSPYGPRYCLLVIDHHTNFMWVRFLKSKDETCAKLETILLDARHTHARFHSQQHAFAPFLKFDSEAANRLGGSKHASHVHEIRVQHSVLCTIRASHAWESETSVAHSA